MADSAKNDVSLTLDRDALKLLFRNALSQKAVRPSAGLLIVKLAAVNKMCLDSVVRVTNQFGYAILTTDQVALRRDRWTSPAIVITRSHFVWMLQWKMLRLQALTIASKNASGWHSLGELFFSRCLVSRCIVDVLEVYTDRLGRFTLDLLDGVDAKDIAFYPGCLGAGYFTATNGATNESVRRISVQLAYLDVSDVQLFRRVFPNLTEIELDVALWSEHSGEAVPDLLSLQEVGQYLASVPAMPVLSGNVNLEVIEEGGVTHAWTAENVLNQYGKLQEMREEVALVPPQLTVSLWTIVDFHRVSESQTKEADRLAGQLGFSRQRIHGVNKYALEAELAPGRDLSIVWEVSDSGDSHV